MNLHFCHLGIGSALPNLIERY
uniref:Uncharacterized protein n=1 Tax=Lepeophtheirus salmonis TaxID=72036 RepID=A0A0K2T2I5_LEPSM